MVTNIISWLLGKSASVEEPKDKPKPEHFTFADDIERRCEWARASGQDWITISGEEVYPMCCLPRFIKRADWVFQYSIGSYVSNVGVFAICKREDE